MGYTIVQPLPTGEELKKRWPRNEEIKASVRAHRKDIGNIIEGRDDRKIVIVGPCSAWPKEAVLDYAKKLLPLSLRYQDRLKIIMRVYIQKPRTTIGWVGSANQPDPFQEPDIIKGIDYCRSMMLQIASMGLPLADEAVFTQNADYFADLLSWIAIGARSSENQEHRMFASMIPHTVGIKNPTSGDLDIATNSLLTAQSSHVFSMQRNQIKSTGNRHAHLVLRGGRLGTNYDKKSVKQAYESMLQKSIQNPAIIIDVSHDNSADPATNIKHPQRQPVILKEIMQYMQKDQLCNKIIKGFMIESFLESGAQKLNGAKNANELKYGVSITDGCLGWESTEEVLENMYKNLA